MSNTTTFGNVTIHTIDHVLGFPGSLAETVALDNTSLALLAPLLRNVSLPSLAANANASVPAPFFDVLNGGLHGFTFFAPDDGAIAAALAAGGLASLAANRSAAQALFQNHVSSLPFPSSFCSSSGEKLTTRGTAADQRLDGVLAAPLREPDVRGGRAAALRAERDGALRELRRDDGAHRPAGRPACEWGRARY